MVQSALFSNPDIFASLLSLVSQGANVGSFPGAALNLPGGSAFGYAPADNSYCLFATTPYTGPAPAPLVAGSPLPAAGPPSQFACVAASSNPPATPGSFSVTLGGEAYICVDNVPTTGRKLQQAPSPVDTAIGNALISVGVPLFLCNSLPTYVHFQEKSSLQAQFCLCFTLPQAKLLFLGVPTLTVKHVPKQLLGFFSAARTIHRR